MTTDVTSIIVSAESRGVKQLGDDLKYMTSAAGDNEKATRSLADSQQASSDAIEALLAKMQKQADLLGANTSETNAYNAAMKGANDFQLQLAEALGAEVDAYKALGVAQTEANKANKTLDDSYRQLQSSADAYYAAQAKAQTASNEAGYAAFKVAEAKQVADAQRELIRMTNDLATAEARLNKDHGTALEMEKARAYRALSDAQREAIKMNKDLDAAESAAARSSQAAFQAIGPTRQTLNDATAAGNKFIENLKAQTATLGMTAQQVKDYNIALMEAKAAQLGVSKEAAPMIQSLKDTAVHAGSVHSGMGGIVREMLVMTHEMSQGNFSRLGGSMLVMAERVNFVPAVMRVATSAMEAMGVGALALTGIIGLVILAVAAFVLALMDLYKHAQAFKELQNALILTGHSAGATAEGLMEVARAAAGANGSISTATKTVLQLAQTGKYTKDQIALITESVVALEHAAGVPIENTIKQFEKLGDGVDTQTIKSSHAVSKNAAEMNAQYHFMNDITFDRIVNLENEGKAHEALALSVQTMADHNAKAAKEVEGNLSEAMKTLHSWGKEIADLWDKIGRAETDGDKRNKLLKKKEDIGNQTIIGFIAPQAVKNAQAKVDQEIYNLDENHRMAERAAAVDAANVAISDARINAQKRIALQNVSLNTMSQAQQAYENRKKDIALQSDEWQKEHAVENAEALKKLEEATHEKVKKARGPGMTGVNAGLKGIQAEQAETQAAFESSLKITDALHKFGIISDQEYADFKVATYDKMTENTLAYYGREIKNYQNFKGKTSSEINMAMGEINKLGGARAKLVAEQTTNSQVASLDEPGKKNKAMQEEIAKTEKLVEGIDKQTQALQFLNAAYAALPEDVRKTGLTEKAFQDAITQQKIDALETNKAIIEEDVQNEVDGAQARLNVAIKEIASLKALKEAQATNEKDTKERNDNMATTAHEKSLTQAAMLEKAYKDSFNNMTDALTTFVTTGKLSFKGFVTSVLTELVRMEAAAATSKLFGAIGEMVASYMGGGFQDSASAGNITQSAGASTQVYSQASGYKFGGAFDSGVQKFADGGSFTNGVVNSPTNFNMGQMGEAGPEAIIPLTRTSDGSLGVKQLGGGSSGPVSVNTVINVQGGSAASTTKTSDNAGQIHKQFADAMSAAAQAEIAKQMRQGGLLWKMKNGQTGGNG